MIDGVIDKAAFEERKARLLAERQGVLERLNEPETKTEAQRLLEKFELGNEAYVGVISLNPDEIRDSLEKTTSNLSIEGKYLAITPRFPFSEIAKERLHRIGALHQDILRKDGTIRLNVNPQTLSALSNFEDADFIQHLLGEIGP